jgi:hypothetical protein
MAAQIQIGLTSNAAEITAGLDAFPQTMREKIATALDAENELTVGHIAEKKLSRRGPNTLGVRSNRLRPSVRRTQATVREQTIDSSIGSNVSYLAAHEFGFTGTVTVRAHRARNRAKDVFQLKGGRRVQGFELTGAGGRGKLVASGYVTVRAHRVTMNIKERAPIRTGIRERADNYTESVSGAVLAAWEGKA